ncbi:MAG TPA: D-2-hydroxyacid dehydrogenase [Longimicrobiaceae bacterium]|jgi:phosphoglycerate dehydrogenase-like enzyme|nr:D-2-hydroxyacid dehydrogenase [Longimicrobiaceae bacterium]
MPKAVIDMNDRRPVWAIPGWAVDEIRSAFPSDWDVVVVDGHADGQGDGRGTSPDAVRAARGAEVYLGLGIPRELFLAATASGELRWMHTASAGVAGALFPEMVESAVVLTNSAGIHAEPIADTVMAMVLHFARGLDFMVRAQAERRWDKATFDAPGVPVRELASSTLGILGLGGIGRAVARRAVALGMRVVATRRSGTEGPDGVEVVTGDDALGRMLDRSDFVAVCVPQTAETEGLIGAAELARMGKGAVLVNVSRGAVVDEEALTVALKTGKLRGAGLDVFAEEPLPAASELWGLPNVLVSPHVSGTSHDFWRRQTDLVTANVRRWLAGQPLLNTVDKTAGY